MKTKREIYENLYKKTVFELKKTRANSESLVICVFLLVLSTFLLFFFKISNLLFIYLFAFPYIPIGLYLVEKGKNITNISEKKIAKQLKITFDKEIEAAKESNFSCEEKIRELEEMRAGLCN